MTIFPIQAKKGDRAVAIVVVLVMSALLAAVMLSIGHRSVMFRKEIDLLEKQQLNRLQSQQQAQAKSDAR
ncbi:MAG TPA: hypothetical protein VGH19_01020 [Verrucomicrobiae bacterium]